MSRHGTAEPEAPAPDLSCETDFTADLRDIDKACLASFAAAVESRQKRGHSQPVQSTSQDDSALLPVLKTGWECPR